MTPVILLLLSIVISVVDKSARRLRSFPSYAEAYPSWGMPYGLPALSDDEHGVLVRWLADGARGAERPPITAVVGAACGFVGYVAAFVYELPVGASQTLVALAAVLPVEVAGLVWRRLKSN